MPPKQNPNHTAILIELDESYNQMEVNRIKQAIIIEAGKIHKNKGAWVAPTIQQMKYDPNWGAVTIYQP